VRLLATTCHDGDPAHRDGIGRACWFLGVHLARGTRIPRDVPAAAEALDRACRRAPGLGALGGGAWRIHYACRDLQRVRSLPGPDGEPPLVGVELDRDDRELITNGMLLDWCEDGDLDACSAATRTFFDHPDHYPEKLRELAKRLTGARSQ
jgi:hypothetical protein